MINQMHNVGHLGPLFRRTIISNGALRLQTKVGLNSARFFRESNACLLTFFIPKRRLHQDKAPTQAKEDPLYKGSRQPIALSKNSQPKLEKEVREAPPQTSVTENIYTIPNFLTFTRLVTAPFVGYYIILGQPKTAIALFAYSSFTDLVDGYIARRFNMQSKVGTIIDPMADKLLMTVCTVSLWYSLVMPVYLAFLIIGRDVMLSFMGFYYRYVSLPAPKTLKRYVDMSIVTVSVHPNMLSKVNTALQMFYIGGLVVQPGLASLLTSDHASWLGSGIDVLGMVVAATTFLSGAYYVFSKKAIEFVKP